VISALLAASELEIETALSPPIRISLDPSSPSSQLTRALRPKVTLRTGGQVVYAAAPHGEPRQSPALLLALAGLALLLLVLTR
jgi:hypothetical protein